MESIQSFEEATGGQRIVAVTQFNGVMILATEKNLYAVTKYGTVELMKFKVVEPEAR